MKKRVILASTSPRRVALLRQAGIRAQGIAPNCDEKRLSRESPAEMVRRLAEKKARSVWDALPNPVGRVVIAADTTVVAPGGKMVLGKPRNQRHAARMLRQISGKTHEVLTGYCLIEGSPGERPRVLCRVVRSKVTLRALSAEMIRRYVATGEPMDKAGSYAAQGFGMNWISSIRGSYTNVVGLPMCELLEDLERHFEILPQGWNP